MLSTYQSVHSFIETQIKNYKQDIELPGGWKWGMKDHIDTSYLYIHSQLKTGKDDFKPVKNITRPILNLQHRTEDIDVKDVQIYANDPSKYHLSFLVKKYHDDIFVVENDLDTYFDELNVSRIDYGAGLSKKLNRPAPETVPLHTIAFCDQTDILSGPLGIEHFYSPDQLKTMEQFGWGNPENGANISVDDLISWADENKQSESTVSENTTPGRYIKVIETHGYFPKSWLGDGGSDDEFTSMMLIVPICKKDDDADAEDYILYAAEEEESPFKLVKRDPVYGRALGFGGAEELFEPQVWVNYDMIRKQDMLDAASKTILKTTDPTLATRNNIKEMENLEIIELQNGTDLQQVDTFPRNLRLFTESIMEWESHAQMMGAANDAIQGVSPAAGTPFKLQELVVSTNQSLHDYRTGIYAKHLEEVYQDWILPHIARMICKGARFLSELSLEDMQYVTDAVATNEANNYIKEKILNGEEIDPQEVEAYKQLIIADFKAKGNKHFIEILKGEFKNVKLSVKVSIKGKSKDLAAKTDGLVNVFRQIIANPAVLQIPAIARIFNDILESSGLDPADFTGITQEQLMGATPGATPGQQPGVEQPAPLTQPEYAAQPQKA